MLNILVATDGSKTAVKALEYVTKIAKPLNAEITVLAVAPAVAQLRAYEVYAEVPNFEENIAEGMRKIAQNSLDLAEKIFADNGLSVKTRLEIGDPASVICEIAAEENYDHLVIGSRGLGGFKGMFLGSVSNRVVNCTQANVTIVK